MNKMQAISESLHLTFIVVNSINIIAFNFQLFITPLHPEREKESLTNPVAVIGACMSSNFKITEEDCPCV